MSAGQLKSSAVVEQSVTGHIHSARGAVDLKTGAPTKREVVVGISGGIVQHEAVAEGVGLGGTVQGEGVAGA